MAVENLTAYDAVEYPSGCWPQSHPEHLATLATLFGMSPAPAFESRVLELGCSDGTNIIAMAFALPGSTFVGVDLAPTAIAKATETAKALGLSNIEFHCADLLDWMPPGDKFDYIIAHGLFSWVPDSVRQRILALCQERLTEQGVAYISYNALPGCHIRGMLREMMLFHARNTSDPREKINQAHLLLQFLIAGRTTDNPFAAIVQDESQRLLERNAESVLFHDDLAAINQPYYFREFAALAGQHGLQFLAEADFSDMQDSIYAPSVVAALRQLDHDIVLKEQYLDFLKCRRFRQTLLCRAGVKLDRDIPAAIVQRLVISSRATPATPNPDLRPGVPVRFTAQKISADVAEPLVKAALMELLSVWPRALTLSALTSAALRRLGNTTANLSESGGLLASAMFAGFANGIVELHTHQFPWIAKRGRRPTLSPLARYQLTNGRVFATNLRHADVRVDSPLLRATLLLMDGNRNVSAIASELRKRIEKGELTLPAGSSVANLSADIERAVQEAVANAMLIAWDDPNL